MWSDNEIYEYLCYYDPRNPMYDEEEKDDFKPRDNCFCDNCFRGLDKLALEMLNMKETIRDLSDRDTYIP